MSVGVSLAILEKRGFPSKCRIGCPFVFPSFASLY